MGVIEHCRSLARRPAVAVLAVVACLLCLATGASAAEYTVDSTGDQPDAVAGAGGCATGPSPATCTLRAAIEESNASTGVVDTIDFDSSFDGGVEDTIELTSSLPTIVDRAEIEGSRTPLQCETDYAAFPGPCVGVDGPSGGTAFAVSAERVVLTGFAIFGAGTAVEAAGAPGLQVKNDWLGLELDGSAGPNETGIHLDRDSIGPWIGGSSSIVRNIFAHNTQVGLDIDGADNAVVEGNGFGVLPDGSSHAANGTDIELTDASAGGNRVATGNWIGGTLTDEQLASSVCDGACNVISGAVGSGIDLVGDDPDEEPASGSTRISGNHIGLNAFGTVGVPNAENGVLVGAASNVTIGGPRARDRNVINGGANGVLAGPGTGPLTVEHNYVGLEPSGSEMLAAPTNRGIGVESGRQIEITRNRIAMAGGVAIEQGPEESVIRLNAIGNGVHGEELPGASVGIHLQGSCYPCALVEDNSIANAADYGFLIENNRNRLLGNRIEASGAAGVRIQDSATSVFALKNRIGGDVAAEENTISRSGGPAIELAPSELYQGVDKNWVERNNGSLNGGPFIVLRKDANKGILPPTFTTAKPAGATGSGALPGATIRVFRKAGDSPGEIEGFLAEALADENGEWSAAYPAPISGGTFVAATQTTEEEGTSELAVAATTSPPDSGDGNGGGGGDAGESGDSGGPAGDAGEESPAPSPVADTVPPRVRIFRGPRARWPLRWARFRFVSSEPGSRFWCRLDRRPVRRCRSPRGYRRLRLGRHVFRVWAIDRAGNRDRRPARRRFWVLRRKPHPARHGRRDRRRVRSSAGPASPSAP